LIDRWTSWRNIPPVLGTTVAGTRCLLRAPRDDDLPLLQHFLADERVTQFTGRHSAPSAEEQREWLRARAADPNGITWVIEADHRPIGTMAIFSIDWISGHGYTSVMIGDTSYWGRGIATEVVALRSAFAFQDLRLHKLRTEVFVENGAMMRAIRRAGFREIGIAHQEHYRGGKWYDVWLGELLIDDWFTMREHGEEYASTSAGPDPIARAAPTITLKA
jgi:ribosomal-protein-alanine N-acetyltransferase